MKRHLPRRSEAGFSMIELLAATAILLIMMAGIFSEIGKLQTMSKMEETKRDMFQNAREVLDQLNRDLHNAGYPNKSLYNLTGTYSSGGTNPLNGATSGTADQQTGNAVKGLVVAQADTIVFEGDVDGDALVDSVGYQYTASAPTGTTFKCPCLMRGQVLKVAGSPLPTQNGGAQLVLSNMNVVVENLLAPGGGIPNIFQFFDKTGGSVAAGNYGSSTVGSIATVKVTLNVQGQVPTGQIAPVASMTTTSRITNY
jgi:prepilin-type N-terminal cleavage/methylation domain-containing protein